jgi:hypothetical protein
MRHALRRAGVPLLLAVLCQQGCDLSTPAPTGVALPGELDGPDGLPTKLAAAIGDFAVGYGGNASEHGFILLSGLMADELHQSIGTSINVDLDERAARSDNPLSASLYRDLQRSRASAERAADAYARLDPAAVGALHARNLAGFAYVLLAEGFCSGIPFSRVAPDGTVVYGAVETTAEVLERAVAAFDSSLAVAEPVGAVHGDSVGVQVGLARLGRARALLDLGRFAEAGTEAALVPDGFVWKLEYSDNSLREVNGVSFRTWIQPEYSAADSEGVNGIAFLGSGDPRVQVSTVDISYAPVEYAELSAPIVLAGATEARLIQAEALLQAGDYSGSLGVLNALRGSIGLDTLTDPGTLDGRITHLFRERAFWLWLTGHRLGDLRRLVRQYGRSSNGVYPTGPYAGTGTYGDQLDLAVYEVNNPRYEAASCDTRQP